MQLHVPGMSVPQKVWSSYWSMGAQRARDQIFGTCVFTAVENKFWRYLAAVGIKMLSRRPNLNVASTISKLAQCIAVVLCCVSSCAVLSSSLLCCKLAQQQQMRAMLLQVDVKSPTDPNERVATLFHNMPYRLLYRLLHRLLYRLQYRLLYGLLYNIDC